MKPEYLFMAGEYKVSMPLVFATTNWSHTMSQTRLKFEMGGEVNRLLYQRERIKGVIHYANCQDSKLKHENLKTILYCEVPCWPDPIRLIAMLDRHNVMAELGRVGLLTSPNVVVTTVHNVLSAQMGQNDYNLPMPDGVFVVKTGNEHRGLGKFLSNEEWEKDLDLFDIVTVEPFYKGRSVRVLIMGNRVFGIEIKNDSSWIKNGPGAEAESFSLGEYSDMVEHAFKVADHFGLDVAGVDYVVDTDNKQWNFLEVNQYPGLATIPEVEEYAKVFLRQKMNEMENQ